MNPFFLLSTTPIPRELTLPLPLPAEILKILLVIFFLVHIFFVNLTVGGSLLVTFFEYLGFTKKKYDNLAYQIAQTVTVNKSLAVVMGIGPLLCISLIYTTQWYAANALTGHAWLLIIPLIIIAFLLAYLHKYKWHDWDSGALKKTHFAISISSSLLFLAIPFVFLANINLMLFPNEWEKVKGFFSSLVIANVFPRYFHFIFASVALAGLAGAGWFFRKNPEKHALADFDRFELRRLFYKITCWATGLQFLAGPILLFTLPSIGITTKLYQIILPSATLGLIMFFVLLHKIKSSKETLANGYVLICIFFTVIVLGMGSGRHAYREAALATHQRDVKDRTADYVAQLNQWNQANPISDEVEETPEQKFATCAACHAPDAKLVGPSLREINAIYQNNPDGIVTWAMHPGKKRADAPQMPSFSHLGPDSLRIIAEYMLKTAPK